jgi:hypothetical protein
MRSQLSQWSGVGWRSARALSLDGVPPAVMPSAALTSRQSDGRAHCFSGRGYRQPWPPRRKPRPPWHTREPDTKMLLPSREIVATARAIAGVPLDFQHPRRSLRSTPHGVTDLTCRGRRELRSLAPRGEQARLAPHEQGHASCAGRPLCAPWSPPRPIAGAGDVLRVFISYLCEMASLPLDFLCPEDPR